MTTKRHLANTLGAYPGVVLVLDEDGVVVDSNGQLDQWADRRVVGREFRDFIHPGSAERWTRATASIRSGQAEDAPLQELTISAGDNVRLLKFFAIPTALSAEGSGGLWIQESLAERQTEAFYAEFGAINSELVNVRRDLEKQRLVLAQRAEHEHELRQSAERAVSAREEILAVVSHDLRNPLAAIATVLEFLETEDAPNYVREQQIRLARRAGSRALDLIESLLEMALVDQGQALSIRVQEVELAALLQETAETFQARAAEANIGLELAPSSEVIVVLADPDRVIQVLGNLVGNALKFTPAEGKISLSMRRKPAPGGDEAIVEVEDTGEGIPQANLPHLFERFWQAKREARRGAGLGLAISKAVIEAHGGTLTAESTEGVGTTMRFSLPLAG